MPSFLKTLTTFKDQREADSKRKEDKKQLECAFNGLQEFKFRQDLKNPFDEESDERCVQNSPNGLFKYIIKDVIELSPELDNGVKYINFKKYNNSDYVKNCTICKFVIEKMNHITMKVILDV